MKDILKLNKFLIATFVLFGFIFWHLAKEMLQVRNDGWYVGHINLWGDLAFHLTLINKFLDSGKLLPDNPIFAGDKINYPIFSDWITAQITRVTGIDFALFITTLLGGFLTIYMARIFIKNFIKNEKVIFLTLLIFFFNGGFGFYYFFQDYLSSGRSIFDFFANLPREYTNIQQAGFWWINVYLAYLLPQRGFLFALPFTLTVLGLLYLGWQKGKRLFFVLAGLLAGALPLVQAHSLFVIFLVSLWFTPFAFFTTSNKKATFLNWFVFAVVTSLIAVPIFQTISSAPNPLKFFRIDPGWTSQENIVWFWLKNLGIFAPILVFSLIWLFKKNRLLFILYFPFLMVFFLSNIFVFQPWNFDNSKLLIYWFFASAIVIAYFINDQFLSESFTKKIIGIIIIFFMTFAGGLDLFRTFTQVTNYQIFSNQDLQVAADIKRLTKPDSIFVTANNHNHPIPVLSGRSTLLGFEGWVWSHGIDYYQRKNDILKIYQGGSLAEDLIKKYKVSYVAVGPSEKSSFSINDNYFAKYPKLYLNPEWVIYDVNHLWADGNR